MTDDRGAIWDTQGHVVPIEWWTGPDLAHKIVHTGKDSWLEFKGMFGNRGSSNCWWHALVGICQLVDGPPGPNRWFGDPPDVSTSNAALSARTNPSASSAAPPPNTQATPSTSRTTSRPKHAN